MNLRALLPAIALLLLAAGCSKETPAPPKPDATPTRPEKTGGPPSNPNLDLAKPLFHEAAPAEYRVRFTTTKGEFDVKVTRDWAPRGADRFYALAKSGFFEGCRFFRVVPGFVVQFGMNGDPKVTARFEESKFLDDAVKQPNSRGTITFATSGPNSRTTQVFINFKDNANLDGMGFSPFGKVTQGMEVVDSINAEYGEAPEQPMIQSDGNDYLEKNFPKLDKILSVRVIE